MGDFKPADIYVGVMELFTVLLPGAFLTAGLLFAMPATYLDVVQDRLPTNAAQWVAFGFCAYALGAFIFPAASRLDDGYDKGYRTAEVAKKGESAYLRASDLRCGVLGPPQANVPASNPMNTFRWAKSTLMLRAPAAFADVQRYEAESKFFRSLTIALPIVGLLTAGRLFAGPMTEPARDAASPCAIAVLVLIATGTLMYLAYLRYAEQRFKSTEWAYVHVIILLSGPLPAPSKTSGE